MPIAAAMPAPSSRSKTKSMVVAFPAAMTLDETPRGSGRRRRTTTGGRAPFHDPRPRALRRAVRAAHAVDEVVGDARPDGGHRSSPRSSRWPAACPTRRTFPAEDFAALMARVAVDSSAARAAVRADRGPRRAQGVHRPGDGGRGHGGRARRPARHHRRPAGDRPRLQDAARPRRRRHRRGADLSRARCRCSRATRPTSCRSRSTTTACGSTLLEEALDRLDAEGRVPKFIYTVPTFQNPGGVTMSLERRRAAGRGRAAARAARARGQPVRAAALRGRPAADAVLARRRRVRHLPRHVLEDPLARAAARLDRGAAAGAGEDEPRQGRHRPLLVVADPALRRRLLRRARLAALPRHADRALPRAGATRCSTRSPSTSRARRRGRGRRAACSSGRRCPTTSTRPTCWRGRCARRTSRSCPAARRTSTAAAARRCG